MELFLELLVHLTKLFLGFPHLGECRRQLEALQNRASGGMRTQVTYQLHRIAAGCEVTTRKRHQLLILLESEQQLRYKVDEALRVLQA